MTSFCSKGIARSSFQALISPRKAGIWRSLASKRSNAIALKLLVTGIDNSAAVCYEWTSISPRKVYELFCHLPVPWWVAGGFAIDLFVGRDTRAHGDFDILVLRKDQLLVQEHLKGWDLHKTNQPGLQPWPRNEYLKPGVNQVWCRHAPGSPWVVEIMFMETDGDRWVYRRATAVGGPLASLGRQTSEGIPYLSPEIQLLYKAKKEPLAKDESDFRTTLPLLNARQKEWLKSALQTQFPDGHHWVDRL